MAISFPLQLSRDASARQQPEGTELSRGNAYRSLERGIVSADLVSYDPDTGVWAPATDPSSIDGLLARTAAPGDPATVLARGAEVSDGAIRYGDLDRDDVNARLYELGIIVRPAVAPPE